MELWALRSAWTLTKSFYSSGLNALNYYLISRSTQAGITTHPEPIDELYKASFLCLKLVWVLFSPSNPTKKSLLSWIIEKHEKFNTVVVKKSVIRLVLCSCLLFKITWKPHNNCCSVKIKLFENIGQLHELKPNKNILIEKTEKKQTLNTVTCFLKVVLNKFLTYTQKPLRIT